MMNYDIIGERKIDLTWKCVENSLMMMKNVLVYIIYHPYDNVKEFLKTPILSRRLAVDLQFFPL